MDKRRILLGAAVAALLTLGAGTAVVAQQDGVPGEENEAGGEGETSLTGLPAERASDAALRATGGGEVLEVERGDDPGAAYEVEIREDDGVTEILLDRGFNVVGREVGE